MKITQYKISTLERGAERSGGGVCTFSSPPAKYGGIKKSPFIKGVPAIGGWGILLLVFSFSLLTFSACKKTDDNTYDVNNVNLLPPGAGKTKQKSNEQYVSILYANLFQQALSANKLFDISQCIESIGDKDIAREVIISNFMNKPDVLIPADSVMQNNPEQFVIDTYNRFLVRNPTVAEKTWFINYINANPNVTPELIYFSFALSNEYMYY